MGERYDIIVAGAGIAGLSAATVAAGLGRRTLILAGGMFGGHLLSIEKIEDYPGYQDGVAGYELCPMAQGEAAAAGAEFAMDSLEEIVAGDGGFRLRAGGSEYGARAVILAMGTSFRNLGIEGEERLRGRGISQCASCDAPLLRDRPVAVIGGGDSACQEALTLAAAASRVTIFHRGASLTASPSFAARIEAEPKIDLRPDTEVTEILGGDVVTGLRVSSGAGDEEIAADAVFAFVGLTPNSAPVAGLVETDDAGAIVTDESLWTAVPGLFAAGTVRAGAAGRAGAAAEEGKSAATVADRFLSGGNWR